MLKSCLWINFNYTISMWSVHLRQRFNSCQKFSRTKLWHLIVFVIILFDFWILLWFLLKNCVLIILPNTTQSYLCFTVDFSSFNYSKDQRGRRYLPYWSSKKYWVYYAPVFHSFSCFIANCTTKNSSYKSNKAVIQVTKSMMRPKKNVNIRSQESFSMMTGIPLRCPVSNFYHSLIYVF